MNSRLFTRKSVVSAVVFTLCATFAWWAGLTHAQQSPVEFVVSFSPAEIGPGSAATMRFDITNNTSSPLTGLEFSNALPSGVTIASPASAVSGCGGTLVAPDGGSSVLFSGGSVGGPSSCTISVNVNGAPPSEGSSVIYTNPSVSLLQSGDPIASAAPANLTVFTDRPGFSKSFAPGIVPFGGRTKLIFAIDNSANSGAARDLTFTDNLPPGVVVAGPANAVSTCSGGTLTAVPGTSVISYGLDFIGGPSVAATTSCSISVDVIGNAVGTLVNTSGNLTSATAPFGAARSSGKATAALLVTNSRIVLQKQFVNDPVAPGGTVDLKFTITNVSRDDTTGISFTDDLDAVLSGLVATGLGTPISTCGGTLSGTGVIAFSGGALFANNGVEDPQFPSSCSFTVALQVPAGAASGVYTNTTSSIIASVGTGDPASDLLFVQPAPLLSMTFLDNPAAAGGTTTLEYTITNSSPSAAASNITFEDSFFEGFQTAASIPADGFCGAGSNATFTPIGAFSPAQLLVSGGDLAPGASCTFSITLDIRPDVTPGTYTNTTGPISGTVGGITYVGQPASDSVDIFAGPRLLKEFTDDPVNPGGLVTLQFTLTHNQNATADATAISFTDDLDAVIPGMVAVGLPLSDICGVGSTLSGTSVVSFSGGNLVPGASCTFSVDVQVPAAASLGFHTNTTSSVAATVGGLATLSPPATDKLLVGSLKLTKSFTNDPVAPGETVDLQFTIDNTQGSADATGLSFTDDLAGVLTGLVATGLPVSGCGGGTLSAFAGNTFLAFSGGSVAAGQSCTFSVTLNVPAGAASTTYPNTTSGLVATIDGNTITFPGATDRLVVLDTPLVLVKAFAGDTVPAGATVGVTFSVVNLHPTNSITGIAFSDNLNAALSGLTATSVSGNTCGGSVNIATPGNIDVFGGSVGPNSSCAITVALQVPAGAPVGTNVINTTSAISGTLGAVPIVGDPASDNILITLPGSIGNPTVTIEQGASQPDPTSTSPIVFDVVFSAEMVDFDSGNDVTLSGGAVTPGLTTATVIPVAPFDGTTYRVEVSGLTNIGTVVATIAAGAARDRFDNPNNASTSVDNVVTFIPGFVNQAIFGSIFTTINQNTTITGNVASQQTVAFNQDGITVNGKVTAVLGPVQINKGVRINGNVAAGGAVTVSSSLPSNMATAGNITSRANVSIGAFASVSDVTAAGTITVDPTSTTGTRTPNAMVDPLPNMLLPDLNFSAGGANVTLPNNGSLTLAPGSYGALVLGRSATLTLSGGSYAFNSIVTGRSSRIVWNAPTTINVVGDVNLGNDSQMSGVASNLLIQVRGTSVLMNSGGAYLGTTLAPNAAISMGQTSTLRGALFGHSVDVGKNAMVTGDVALNLLIAAGSSWTPKVLGLRDENFNSSFFVRQHYLDFLQRDADGSGLAFWKGQLDECENATLAADFSSVENCREVRRINVSAAFFISIEFQNTGYFLYRLNQTAFDSGPTLQFGRFQQDKQEVQRGVIVGQDNWQQQIEDNKLAFANAFVARPEFITAYPENMSAAAFVDALNANTRDPSNPTAGSLSQAERDNLVAQLTNGAITRAQALRSIAENSVFQQREFNRAFVLMQYYGYLRRNPSALPDTDFSGYNFWLNKLNQFNGNFVEAEMVKAFITSGEYLNRFKPLTK